ncbi:26S proteasome non-ATPase regulatory subunit 2-like [Planoprotostelium fungivorum]|uniref:26S proteasome non-ATPase regulatory subunit 2-like n=1 Tax=Planoprotostelium fungivorum TaxID=1890364 RepID=A0A2P6NT97_9EUKA|nr:26S proteasome non-ATPase regulatory subunit 2-like [Planoprotostelium fungivorum]
MSQKDEVKATNNEENKKVEEKKTDTKKKNDKKKKEEELSEEDKRKKEELDLLAERVQDADVGVQKLALDTLITEIKTATSSMTSVPKPLKFLGPHYEKLKAFFDSQSSSENKTLLSDILAVLSMTFGKEGEGETLKYKLQGSMKDIGSWGHEFIRHLSGEISTEWDKRTENKTSVEELQNLVNQIVPFNMQHNAEHEACDLLLEIEKIDQIMDFVDDVNYSKIGRYLTQCASFAPGEDEHILKVVQDIYKKANQPCEALRVCSMINNSDVKGAQDLFTSVQDEVTRKQMALQLGRQHLYFDSSDENLNSLIYNSKLSENFQVLAQDLEITEAKTPEDIYKSNLSDTRGFGTNLDSARQNLASTFVNAFVNAGFLKDKLMTEDGNKWLYKNKEHGMMTAAASLGMVLLWDVDGGLTQIDKYLYANEPYIKAGTLLAVGIVNSGVYNECDPAIALLSEYVADQTNNNIRIGAILGLGIAYTGTAKADLSALLLPTVDDSKASMEVVAMACLSLGMIFVGTGDPEITNSLLAVLMERDEASLNQTHSRFVALALGLLYLGRQQLSEVTLETLKTVTHPIGRYASVTLDTCAYVGTGNVLKIQSLLDMCGDHLTEKDSHQAVATLGIALIAMGEDIGVEMALRSFDHLLQYCEPVVRRAVPLALGLMSVSNPRIPVMDTLSKLSHDSDEEVAMGAIFALGLIGAGTNNSRVANLLRSLSAYWYKEPNYLFLVRVAQGMVFMGKGTISIAPYDSDRSILSRTAMAGLLTVAHACLDFKNIILSKNHYLLFTLVSAMYPRMLMTFDENMKPLPVPVRVGQAVDTIGQAGKPKTITGFQTHTTPVLLGYNDRAELATDDYLSAAPIMEGFVILKPNPNAPPPTVVKQ